MRETFTAYISKYAISKGILEIQAIDLRDGVICDASNSWNYFHGFGKEWHLSKESALSRAEEMRLAKIESLKKQILTLEKKRFS